MTSVEFDNCKTAFFAALEMSQNLQKWGVPSDKRLEQLGELSTAASRLIPFTSQVLLPENKAVSEGMFGGRDLYHSLVNPDNLPNAKFPSGYEVFRTFTRQVVEKRNADKAKVSLAAASSAGKSTKTKTRSQTAKAKEGAEDSETEYDHPISPQASHASAFAVVDQVLFGVSQMNVDDDAAPKKGLSELKFKKKAKETNRVDSQSVAESTATAVKGKKNGSSKRPRTDSNPFNEEAFLTASAAEFYTTSGSIPVMIDEVTSIARQDSDFLGNRLAMTKRIYYINVELSCILEQFRSSLLRRTQLIEEGQFLTETIQKLDGASSSGLDSMVP
ncbi:hypothetical protein DFH07DRAFT_955784 [Mycena maculata]|uniref:Uncharacterized protein n=1 Tax=Mycena maculata TaxID=230809 RepID=A0AAD7JHM1_9AGAR|nr:hypothetical protein DFH07DRAFT_955784 [Mycena maculata]